MPVTTVARKLEQIHDLTVKTLLVHGLGDWTVFWSMQLHGDVARTCVPLRRIVFSAPLLAVADESEGLDVALHEVAHALVDTDGVDDDLDAHGEIWRAKATELGSSGKIDSPIDVRLFPAWAACPLDPDNHFVGRLRMPTHDTTTFCTNHDGRPVDMIWTRNDGSAMRDPAVRAMARTHPVPAFIPTYGVGDVVNIRNAPDYRMEVLRVGRDRTRVRLLDGGDTGWIQGDVLELAAFARD